VKVLVFLKRLVGISPIAVGAVVIANHDRPTLKSDLDNRKSVGRNVQAVMPDRFEDPSAVRDEFSSYPRRALIVTTVTCETHAVRSHLSDSRWMMCRHGNIYEYARFAEPKGDWLVVHAQSMQGNSAAALTVGSAYYEFGEFQAIIFVGVAGSLKEDIPIGSVVAGDYVHNGHSAKVADDKRLERPISHSADHSLLMAAQALIANDAWRDLIKSPQGMELPEIASYLHNYPPIAFIKGIVSGEEVVAGGKSPSFKRLRDVFNNCGAVEMEGWAAMQAAHRQSTPAIIVRGISDMCAGKDHAADVLHQPIAAAHAAAFAFSILSVRSRSPARRTPLPVETVAPLSLAAEVTNPALEQRAEFVLIFAGSPIDWDERKVATVLERFKKAWGDELLSIIRLERGSVRLVVRARAKDIEHINLEALRTAASEVGVNLLGAVTLASLVASDEALAVLALGSRDLLSWERTLPTGNWMVRPEEQAIEIRFALETSTTVLLGEPGSGKSALLSKIGAGLIAVDSPVLAIKADYLKSEVNTEEDLQRELMLPDLPSALILKIAETRRTYVLIDQLDALASQLDLKSGRLNVLLNLVRRVAGNPNVHVLLSARTFEFNHDVRLRATEAEAISLALPAWRQVSEQLAAVGVDADTWPERARDVVRIPQALKTFISLVKHGLSEPFTTYQAMLARFWSDRIASAKEGRSLVSLAESLAGQMAEEEVLWLAASRFDTQLMALNRLEALGLIVRSSNGLSVAFSHQTLFDFVLARTFVQDHGLLAKYVLERQDSLFVRSKVWSALNYLRGAEEKSYQREFSQIWSEHSLRRHLRLLLIEFLGQIRSPLEFERGFMSDAIEAPDTRAVALKSISQYPDWVPHFAQKEIRGAMGGPEGEAFLMASLLGVSWPLHGACISKLIEEIWLPNPSHDSYTWTVVSECTKWTDDVVRFATSILARTDIATWAVSNLALTLAVDQPEVALRLVRVKLDFLLEKARAKPAPPPFPSNGDDVEQTTGRHRSDERKTFRELLDAQDWTDLPSLAEAAPSAFISVCWPWYLEVFGEILKGDHNSAGYLYPGSLYLELDFGNDEELRYSRERPVIEAIRIAVERLAQSSQDQFQKWVFEQSSIELMPVQQLIARGFETAGTALAGAGLRWLLGDQRRFQLGNLHGHRSSTINLVSALTNDWTDDEVRAIEVVVKAYRPPVPDHLVEASQRKFFADAVRATKKDLLQAIGPNRLSSANQELVVTEQRALGDRFDRSISMGKGGVIGSPMDSADMLKAKDRDILKIFSEVPDKTNWDHPTHWMRGGNIQLSRAFADFAKADPNRAVRLMHQFEPGRQERAAGYALDALAENAEHDELVITTFMDMHSRGFKEHEFRGSAVRAIEKLANRRHKIDDSIADLLESWLANVPDESDGESDSAVSDDSDFDIKSESLLWGHGGATALPSGTFDVLSALASILLNQGEPGRNKYVAILERHLDREGSPKLWKALLYRLGNAGGSAPIKLSAFIRRLFDRVPKVASTREAVLFLAHAQSWDDMLVFDLIKDWEKSNRSFLQRAHGELVGLVGIVKSTNATWQDAMWGLVNSGSDNARIGVAHAAVNLVSDIKFRSCASNVLVALLKSANAELVAVVVEIFRLTDDFDRDPFFLAVLRALAAPGIDLSLAPSHFIVERLQQMLPYEAELVALLAGKLVEAWRSHLADIRTSTSAAAPQLTDLALTLHRLGGPSREAGVALFEIMIEIDAYGARDTLAEIDGRFNSRSGLARPRLARRRRKATSRS